MNLSTPYNKLPIRAKLRLMVLLSASAALVAASGTVLAYEEVSFRSELRNDLEILAEMFGSNSTAALSFNDRQTATELLSGLGAKRRIVSATLYSADGGVFATQRAILAGMPVLAVDDKLPTGAF
jgi:uncharacterized membrane protein affecting hemolysin expression